MSAHARTAVPALASRGIDAAVFTSERVWSILVWVAMAAWTVALFLIARHAYVDFRTARYDLGNMVQAVWSTVHGRPLEVTNGYTGEQMIRLGGHVDPILVLLAPLWVVWSSPLSLVLAQVAAVALGALPVFWLGRRHLGSEAAAGLLAIAYLAYPWVGWTAFDAFHPVTLAIPLLLFCFWFLDTGRPIAFGSCALLALVTGELVGLTVGALGVWVFFARRRRVPGLLIACVGVGWTLFALKVVVPAFSGGDSVFYGAYERVGGSPWGVMETAISDPGRIASAAGQPRDFLYLFFLAAPLLGAFVLAPGLALVAAPQLAANLLAGFGAANDPRAHYIGAVVPLLFASVVVGLRRLAPSGRLLLAAAIAVVSIGSSALLGPWSNPWVTPATWGEADATTRSDVLRRAVAAVPEDAPVSTTNGVGSHLAARRYVYSVPVIGRARWIVVDSTDSWIPRAVGGGLDPERLRAFLRRLEGSSQWVKTFDREGVLVFQRRTP